MVRWSIWIETGNESAGHRRLASGRRPGPVKSCLVLLLSARRQMGSRVQRQSPLRLKALNDKAALSLGGSVGDEVAEVNLLQSWDDPVCTGPSSQERAIVNPASRIPASPSAQAMARKLPDGRRWSWRGWSRPAAEALCRRRGATCGVPREWIRRSGRDGSIPIQRPQPQPQRLHQLERFFSSCATCRLVDWRVGAACVTCTGQGRRFGTFRRAGSARSWSTGGLAAEPHHPVAVQSHPLWL
jgi:hypothetical protein